MLVDHINISLIQLLIKLITLRTTFFCLFFPYTWTLALLRKHISWEGIGFSWALVPAPAFLRNMFSLLTLLYFLLVTSQSSLKTLSIIVLETLLKVGSFSFKVHTALHIPLLRQLTPCSVKICLQLCFPHLPAPPGGPCPAVHPVPV